MFPNSNTVKQKVGVGSEGGNARLYKRKEIERGFWRDGNGCKMGKHFYFLMFQWYIYILNVSQP